LIKSVKSSCSLNCWDNCGFDVSVENGKIVKVEGDLEHPITKGKICGRGRMLEKRTNSSERLLYPLKKINGKFERIEWKQALDEIANKMEQLKKKYGTTSILHNHDYANGGLLKNLDYRFFNCYGGVTELTGSLCWAAGIEAQKWDFGTAFSHDPDDILNSKNIVIWGRNIAVTNMHLYIKLQEAKEKGASIVVIDPIYNATAKIADVFVPLKPGTDGLLALGIIKVILLNKLEDREFIKNYTHGYTDLEKLIFNIKIEDIEKYTGVSRETIEQLAKIYVDKPTSTFMGLGMQRYVNGGNTIRCIDALVAVTGNIGIPGGGANYANLGVGQSFDLEALMLPERKTSGRLFTRVAQAEQILTANDPEIHMIFVSRGNPLTQLPDTNRVKKAFNSVDTVVVIDQFLTDTAEMADYVLPCATVFEEEDIYYSSMYHHYANYSPRLVEPQGEAKSDLWIWTELANRLGFGGDFNYTNDEFFKMGLKKLENHNITLEKFKVEHRVELPVQKVPWENKKFLTPSGKFEFTSYLAEKQGYNGKIKAVLPQESQVNNPELFKKFPYQLITMHPARSNHSQNYHLIPGIQNVVVEISESIACKNGINDGDKVTVYNNRGEIEGVSKIINNVQQNVVSIREGQWDRFGGSANKLTPSSLSDIGLGSTFYDCLVNIKKLDGHSKQ
jgi:anaerobic selenocysteine-containing dehydrogenase